MSVIDIDGIPAQIRPHHIFTYEKGENKCIGGIWFVTWLDGFKKGDLGIYSEALFRYLTINYSEDYTINPTSCIIVDASSMQVITYDQVFSGEIPSLIDTTINDMNEYLN